MCYLANCFVVVFFRIKLLPFGALTNVTPFIVKDLGIKAFFFKVDNFCALIFFMEMVGLNGEDFVLFKLAFLTNLCFPFLINSGDLVVVSGVAFLGFMKLLFLNLG